MALLGLPVLDGDGGASVPEPEKSVMAETTAAASEQQSMLVCDVGSGRQVAIPLEMVERLEELSVSQIQQTDSGIAANYRGTVLPIFTLGASVAGDDGQASVQVVVHRRHDQLIGVVVERILDVVAGESVVQASTDPAASGPVMGMTLAGGRVLEVLDLGRI